MKPKFEATEDGIEIIDPIERRRYRLTTHEPVSPEPVDTDRIQFPVATAVEITTEMITLPTNETVYVRDKDGLMIAEVRPNKQVSLPCDKYTLDLSGPLKVYAQIRSSIYIYSDSDRTYITFDKSTHTTLGFRSYHRRPAGMITTTEDPTDVMQAVSTFGSALKSTTAERSYPTYQGHPPAIKLDHELHIPDEFKRLDTGIQIEVPPTLSNIFVVTPLAYYLDAKVVPGPEPQLVTKSEFTYNLEGEEGFETTVERVLKQIFFLDCIVRTEGVTPLPLHEQQVIKSKFDINIDLLYNKSLVEQIKHYLSISFDTIEEHLPDWRLEVKLSPTRDMVEFLPFIANRLAIVTVHSENETSKLDVQNQIETIEGFTRHDPEQIDGANQCETTASNCQVQISAPTIKQSWSGDESSNITSTTPLAAFHNGLGRIPREGAIEITVICNDQNMKEELTTVNNLYGNREELPFDVSIHHGVTKKDLEEILSQKSDFVHYIGHTDQDGMQCTDGKLNGASIETVGAKAFLLNACESHKQGMHLIEAGSLGGIVTLGDIVNNGAVRVGSMIAKLLNHGFPLYAALDITKKQSISGEQYQIVGNGITTIAQSKTGAPNVCTVTQKEGRVNIRMKTYVATGTEKGSLFTPYIESVEKYYILPGITEEIPIAHSHLKKFFNLREFPVIIDGSVEWSDNINASDFY